MKRSHLSKLLRDRGLSQSSVAARLGVDKATVSRWLAGKVPPERAIEMERLVGVERHLLRPDLWSAPSPSEVA